MAEGRAFFRTIDYLKNITTGTTIAGSPTSVNGCAFASFQVIGLGDGQGLGTGGSGLGTMIVQGTLAMPAVGSPTWVPMSVTNIQTNATIGNIVQDGIYGIPVNQAAYIAYVRVFVTTLSWVVDGRLDVTGMIQSMTSSD